nr:MAG TPA: hypothetical protein [Caudoviricetes sp.]
MQDDLRFAVPAKNRQAIRLGLRGDPQQSLVSPTHWAGDPSVLRDQCITFGFYSQPIFASFFRLCLKKPQPTSIKLSYSFIPYKSFSKLKHLFFHRFFGAIDVLPRLRQGHPSCVKPFRRGEAVDSFVRVRLRIFGIIAFLGNPRFSRRHAHRRRRDHRLHSSGNAPRVLTQRDELIRLAKVFGQAAVAVFPTQHRIVSPPRIHKAVPPQSRRVLHGQLPGIGYKVDMPAAMLMPRLHRIYIFLQCRGLPPPDPREKSTKTLPNTAEAIREIGIPKCKHIVGTGVAEKSQIKLQLILAFFPQIRPGRRTVPALLPGGPGHLTVVISPPGLGQRP